MLNGKKIVTLCISKINDETSFEYIVSLNKELAKLGYNLFVYATCADLFWNTPGEEGEANIFELINYDITDAVIVFDEKIYNKECVEKIISKAKAANVPVITIGDAYEGCMNIKFDYEYGFEQVVRHVIDEHECEKLHFMAGIKGNEFSEKRLAVFKKVLAEKNIPFSDEIVSYGDFWSLPTETATLKIIESGNLPEAIICANDTMALTVSAVLRKNGIEIPDDVIVTGFDGIETIHFSIPKITSCKCSYEDIAVESVSLLTRYFSGDKADETVYISPRLIPYESCGCSINDNINVSEYIGELSNRFFRFQVESRSLTEISEKIQICTDIREIPEQISYNIIYDMCCILSMDCINESINPLTPTGNSNDEEMFILFDTDDVTDFKQRSIMKHELVPNLEALLKHNIPIIFVALNFLNIPLGYTCFHFHSDEMANYCKIPQTVSALNNAIGGFRNMRYQQYLNRQIEEMYLTDALTGLYNRNGFLKQYKKLIKDMPKGEMLTVVLADLDGLKPINDTFGHNDGDNAIQVVAHALKAACPDDAICMRFGGDEMVAVMRGDRVDGKIRRNISTYLEDYNRTSGKPYIISSSVGIYAADITEGADFEELVKKSDKLMYIEKQQKKKDKNYHNRIIPE